jgi:DNA-binding response OmpR family regulator
MLPMPYRCMIVEDQALIAIALEASLEEVGFEVAGIFATNVSALDWLAENTPEIALLDLMLKDGACSKLARTLRTRGVPFAIYSGLPVPRHCPSELDEVPWLEKPVSRQALAATLSQLGACSRLPSSCPSRDAPQSGSSGATNAS